MPEFLKLTSLADARDLIHRNLAITGFEEELIDTLHSLGRVISRPVISDEDSPAFTRSSVDGFAVKAADTHGANDSLPSYLNLIGEVEMGKAPGFILGEGQAAVIHTGGMLPEGADAVVMMEYTQTIAENEVEIYKPVAQGENLLLKSEDVKPGDLVISCGVRIRPEEIGGLLALGITRVHVYVKPVVHIFSSGDEVIPPDRTPLPGQVRDINAPVLSALVESCGGIPIMHPIVPDDPEKLEGAVREVFDQADLIIVTAGSSASTRDMTATVLNRMGRPGVLVHGINIRPGKPTILAVCDGKPMIGLPGNPVSALVIARLLVKPLVETLSGQTEPTIENVITAHLTLNLSSITGREDFLPVRVYRKENRWTAEPVFFKSNLIFSLSRANGLLHIPADVTGYAAGDQVQVLVI